MQKKFVLLTFTRGHLSSATWCEMGCPLLRARSKKLLMFPFFIGLRQMAGIVIGSNDGGANMALESKTT